MGIKERMRQVFGSNEQSSYDGEIKLQIPEERELRTYLEEERRDEIRRLCYEKRKERLNKMFGFARYGEQEDNYNNQNKELFNNQRLKRNSCPLGGRASYLKPYKFNAR